MRVVVDANVLYQALRDSGGASSFILSLIRNGEAELALSVSVFEEYRDVLNRQTSLKDLGLGKQDISSVLEFLAYIAEPVTIHYNLRPNLRDEADNMFVELAFASQARYLVTSNIRDFRSGDLKFDSFEVITPTEFVKVWRKDH